MITVSCFFLCFIFFSESWIFWILQCGNSGNQILSYSPGLLFLLIECCSLLFCEWHNQTIFAKIIIFVVCGYWSPCSIIPTLNLWPYRNFLESLDQIRRKRYLITLNYFNRYYLEKLLQPEGIKIMATLCLSLSNPAGP